jgi:hypothetical protein
VSRALRGITVALVTLLGTGCSLKGDLPWEPVDRPHKGGGWVGPKFSIQVPDGWIRLNDDEDEALLATRDGFLLQSISVRRMDVDEPLKNTKKRLREGMSAKELAEVLVDDLRASPGFSGVKVLETRPATVAGQPGFRATVAFMDEGLRRQAVLVGMLAGEDLWRLSYVAPARHYYELDLKTFEAALESFRVW